MKKTKSFLLNGLSLTASALLMQTVGMYFNIYISKKIGAEAIGLYQLILSIYLFFITLGNAGIGIATTRVVSEELAFNNKSGTKFAIKKCLKIALITGTCASLILLLFSKFIVTVLLHNKITQLPLLIICISLPFISMSSAIHNYFTALEKISKSISTQIFEQTMKIISTTFLINLVFPNGLEYACISLVLGNCVSEILSFTYIFLQYKLNTKKIKTNELTTKNYTKEILTISVPIAITSYIRSGLSTLKQLLIPMRLEHSGMDCTQALAQYGTINGMILPIITFPSILINSFSTLIIPEFSKYYATKNAKQIKRIAEKIFRISLLFSSYIFAIFLTFSEKLCTYIYSDNSLGIYLLELAPIVLIMYLDTIVDSILKGLNEQVSVMKCNILDLFMSITLIYILLPIYKLQGYIIVLYISELMNGFISIRKLVSISKIKINMIDILFKPLICVFICRYIFNLFLINISTNLILQIILFSIFYLLVLSITKLFKIKDFI